MADQDNLVPGSGYGNIYVDSLIWGARWVNAPIFYYFGEGDAIDEFGDPFFGRDWRSFEIDAFEQAIQLYENVCNLTFQLAPSEAAADIVWWAVDSAYIGPGTLGVHEIPDGQHGDPIYGYFNQQHSTWTSGTLEQGGYGFVTIIHEMGHGVGLAHPHDGGGEGDASVFPGVSNSRDTGDFGLNQGIWTMMSYIDGWRPLLPGSFAYGWEGGPMAFDIAALQTLYGKNMSYNTGDQSYVLPGMNVTGTFWSCIWDADGIDVISAAGLGGNCVINLNDATLEPGPNAGGYVSWMAGIRGGFTIANGVEIENAIGGKGNDKLTGNEAANSLTGGLGKDTLDGGIGGDSLSGGGGNDLYFVDDLLDEATEDQASAAGGLDLVQSSVDFVLNANIENLVLTGLDNIDGTGNDLANILTGNKGGNRLDGGLGADKMIGGAGNDIYIVDDKADVVIESLAGVGGGVDTIESKVSLILGANFEHLTLTGGDDVFAKGNASANELAGNGGSNSIAGLAGNDTLMGGGGDDTVDGGVGADNLAGGEGDDLYVQDSKLDGIDEAGASLNDELRTNQILSAIVGGIEHYSFIGGKSVTFTADGQNNRIGGTTAADTLIGAAGDDTLNGGAGGDSLSGGDGNDVYVVDNKADKIADSDGTDRVESAIAYILGENLEDLTLIGKATIGTGNVLSNDIIGNAFANKLDGAGGADILTGGDGNDIYVVDDTGDDVVETDDAAAKGGIDLIVSMVNYVLGANEENLTLDAKGTAALATGNELNNILIGNGLDNTLEGGAGIDRMAGGAGNDSYRVDSSKDVVIESLKGTAGGTDTVESEVSFTLGANLEHLTLLDSGNIDGTGNAFDNDILGNSGNNKLSGLAGADTLTGGGGNDTLDGGAGVDKMAGGSGDDVYIQDNAADLVEESGADVNDELRTNQALPGVLPDIEHYSFLGAVALNFVADGAANRISGTKAADKIDGGDGNDTLVGNAGNDTLTGGIGNDSLDGGAGNDSLIGGDGNDVYVVNSAADKIFDSDGSDTVQSVVTFALGADVEDLQLLGAAAINGTGNDGGNVITGNAGANKLIGGGGADTLNGGLGNDVIFGDDGADSLEGGVGNDVIVGGKGADSIDVSVGNDRIFFLSDVDVGDLISGFDGDALGGQDQVNLDALLDSLAIAAKDRATRVNIVDNGSTVEISVDTDGNIGNGFELAVATLNTADSVTVGADVILGS